MSLGGGAFPGSCDNDPTAIASNRAVDAGVVVVAATGNNGFTNAIAAPACGSKVIAVGAVTDTDGRTAFSNEGSELDVVAPGVSITSTVPTGQCALCDPTGFRSLDGTSMATPHVSAAAALLLETLPTLTPQQTRAALQNTALDLGVPGFDTIYGYGRINAFAAYQSINSPPPPPQQIFFDDFQTGFTKWTESGEPDWIVKKPVEVNIPTYPSTNTVADAADCDTGCTLTMTNSVDLTPYTGATLKFWRYVDNDVDNGEYLKVEVFNGSTWNQIYYWTNGLGDDNIWHQETFDLSGYLGTSNFKIRFVAYTNYFAEEVEVDDISIEGQ
jgi:hypothetical protein